MLSRPEVGTREHVLLWLAGEPADKRYVWESIEHCAAAQYARSVGWEYIYKHEVGWELCLIAAGVESRTFGELYERCRRQWRL